MMLQLLIVCALIEHSMAESFSVDVERYESNSTEGNVTQFINPLQELSRYQSDK
jgi:hypothetical protein